MQGKNNTTGTASIAGTATIPENLFVLLTKSCSIFYFSAFCLIDHCFYFCGLYLGIALVFLVGFTATGARVAQWAR